MTKSLKILIFGVSFFALNPLCGGAVCNVIRQLPSRSILHFRGYIDETLRYPVEYTLTPCPIFRDHPKWRASQTQSLLFKKKQLAFAGKAHHSHECLFLAEGVEQL